MNVSVINIGDTSDMSRYTDYNFNRSSMSRSINYKFNKYKLEMLVDSEGILDINVDSWNHIINLDGRKMRFVNEYFIRNDGKEIRIPLDNSIHTIYQAAGIDEYDNYEERLICMADTTNSRVKHALSRTMHEILDHNRDKDVGDVLSPGALNGVIIYKDNASMVIFWKEFTTISEVPLQKYGGNVISKVHISQEGGNIFRDMTITEKGANIIQDMVSSMSMFGIDIIIPHYISQMMNGNSVRIGKLVE